MSPNPYCTNTGFSQKNNCTTFAAWPVLNVIMTIKYLQSQSNK